MKKFLTLLTLTFLPLTTMSEPLAKPTVGTLDRLTVDSRHVAPRPVDVWLPDGYAEQARAGQRFQVLYMHDGQVLFDPSITWNKQSWHVDVALDKLMRAGQVPATIVVGVWNTGDTRYTEYYPDKFLPFLPEDVRRYHVRERLKDKPLADAYLRFLVEELKPLIDRRYATRPEQAATFTMGSSMGGLISVYAMSEYPQVFGGAAGLSTHWIGGGEHNAALPLAAFNYLSRHLPPPQGHRLYQDRGGVALDALYAPYQTFVDTIVREKGYTEAGYLTRAFETDAHEERAWAARLAIPLQFLLKQ